MIGFPELTKGPFFTSVIAAAYASHTVNALFTTPLWRAKPFDECRSTASLRRKFFKGFVLHCPVSVAQLLQGGASTSALFKGF